MSGSFLLLGRWRIGLPIAFLFSAVLFHRSAGAAETNSVADLTVVSNAVQRLLESRGTEDFARALAPSIEDWRAARSTNVAKAGERFDENFRKGLDYTRSTLAQSAEQVLSRATSLGLDSAKVSFRVKSVTLPGQLGSYRNPSVHGPDESLPWAHETEIVVDVQPLPGRKEADRLAGEYRLKLGGGMRFPTGWRFHEGVRWTSFPPGVLDEKTAAEEKIASAIASAHRLQMSDDPALKELGQAVIQYLSQRDVKLLTTGAFRSIEEVWSEIQKEGAARGQPLPPRKEFEAAWNDFQGNMVTSARAALNFMERVGIDFRDAKVELKDVAAESVYGRGAPGSLDNVHCGQIRFIFSVESAGRTKSGRPVTGDYTFAASRGLRIGGRWFIEDQVRWQSFPEGLLDAKEVADLQFENHVAERGVLPPGTATPEIEVVRIPDEARLKLSSLRGKLVLLEFWASWCGPCQEPMARLQALAGEHPEWKDRVEIITVSIDDELGQAKDHLQKRGWTNALNTWAGPGGWKAEPAKAFRVRGVPTAYIIDRDGKVAQAGHFVDARQIEMFLK